MQWCVLHVRHIKPWSAFLSTNVWQVQIQQHVFMLKECLTKDAVGLFCQWGLVHVYYDITEHPRPVLNTCFIYVQYKYLCHIQVQWHHSCQEKWYTMRRSQKIEHPLQTFSKLMSCIKNVWIKLLNLWMHHSEHLVCFMYLLMSSWTIVISQ
jgi:hypothetical protein